MPCQVVQCLVYSRSSKEVAIFLITLLMLTVVTLSLLKYCATSGGPWTIIIICICHCQIQITSVEFFCLLHQNGTFQVDAVSLGKLQKVLLRCEAGDRSQRWYCEKVIVSKCGTTSKSIFTCERQCWCPWYFKRVCHSVDNAVCVCVLGAWICVIYLVFHIMHHSLIV